MPGKRKCDSKKLQTLLEKGISQKEIALQLGVTEATVSRHKKTLTKSIAAAVANRDAIEIVEDKIDALQQLRVIHQDIKVELDWIRKRIELKKIEDPSQRAFWQDQKVKLTAETRKQLNLLLEIAKTLYHIEEVKEYQRVVLESINACSPELRQAIVEELQRRLSIRKSVGGDTG